MDARLVGELMMILGLLTGCNCTFWRSLNCMPCTQSISLLQG
jgi:hypothetical protein